MKHVADDVKVEEQQSYFCHPRHHNWGGVLGTPITVEQALRAAMLGSGLLGSEPQFAVGGGPDPTGSDALGAPRAVRVDGSSSLQSASLEDRGVRGAVLRWEGDELPLTFADTEHAGAMLTVTVHEAVHPDCERKGQPVALTCASPAEAARLQREIGAAIEQVNRKHWGISKSFMREQFERWDAERRRCQGMIRSLTVHEYFQDIGLGHVYDETWSWCTGVLSGLEAKEQKTAADERDIAYYTHKVNKTEPYEDMELTDYMNTLKHQDLAPANKHVSYADFIAAESDSSGRRKVGKPRCSSHTSGR